MQALAHRRVAVRRTSPTDVDQLDDELGHVIARRRLAAEDERARRRRRAVGPDFSRRYCAMTCRTFRCWRLYSWMRLTCTSNIELGIDRDAGALRARRPANSLLVGALDARATASRKPASSASGSSRASWSRSVTQPSPIASLISRGQPRIAQRHPAPRRDAVGLVAELLRPQRVEVRAARPASAARECSSATPLIAWLPTQARLRHAHVALAAARRSATAARRARRRRRSGCAPRRGSAR